MKCPTRIPETPMTPTLPAGAGHAQFKYGGPSGMVHYGPRYSDGVVPFITVVRLATVEVMA
jgi:hypothetical protein